MFDSMSFGPKDTLLTSHTQAKAVPMADDWEVMPSDIVVDQTLGEGAFGEVYKGFIKGPIVCSRVKPSYRNAVHVTVAIKLLKGIHTQCH